MFVLLFYFFGPWNHYLSWKFANPCAMLYNLHCSRLHILQTLWPLTTSLTYTDLAFFTAYTILFSLFFPACTQPAWPTNGVAIASGLNFNASVQYRCFSGYLVSGPSLGRCLADGSWSIPTPTCLIGNNNSLLNFPMHVYVVKRRKCIQQLTIFNEHSKKDIRTKLIH